MSVAALGYFWLVPPRHAAHGCAAGDDSGDPAVFAWRAWSEHPTIERTIRCRKVVLNGNAEAWCQVRELIDRVVRTHRWSEWLWSRVDGHKVRHQYP